ncbi:Hypothetical_protein [Hexamita inflata]|uniref:Hypothetical_protein n=1 Tax=Hexamita inflata TaxID=28002 RepID=A0ABP1HC82_9EUKA
MLFVPVISCIIYLTSELNNGTFITSFSSTCHQSGTQFTVQLTPQLSQPLTLQNTVFLDDHLSAKVQHTCADSLQSDCNKQLNNLKDGQILVNYLIQEPIYGAEQYSLYVNVRGGDKLSNTAEIIIIVGCVLGGVLVIVIGIFVVRYCMKKNKKQHAALVVDPVQQYNNEIK